MEEEEFVIGLVCLFRVEEIEPEAKSEKEGGEQRCGHAMLEGMFRSIAQHAKAAGLLLCALIAVMSVIAPICPACDGLGDRHLHHSAYTNSVVPPASDHCDGACSCCGFHYLRALTVKLPEAPLFAVMPAVANERSHSWFTATPFLPPRA